MNLSIGHANEKEFSPNAQNIVTGRTCVIGQSGSGKSYLMGVICEKLCENNIGFCIIDTEGEYFSLKEKFDVLWVGGENSDINIMKVDFKRLVEKLIKDNISCIIDVSDVIDDRRTVADFCSKLYEVESKLRQPYLLLIEESDKFVPQSRESLDILEEISKRGRKRGLGILIASQRPALVNKNVLSQCNSQFIGKLTTVNDLQAVSLFFSSRRELEELPNLKPGEFFAMGDISTGKVKMHSVERVTQHKGLTPQLLPKPKGKISEVKEIFAKFPQTEKKFNAFSPSLTREEAEKIIVKHQKKKFLVFGSRPQVEKFELIYKPFVLIQIKYPKGFIRKVKQLSSFILDGETAKLVDLSNYLKFYQGFESLLGLEENDIKILKILKDQLSATEIEIKYNIPLAVIRKAVGNLTKHGLIDIEKRGRLKLYKANRVVIPDFDNLSEVPKPNTMLDMQEEKVKFTRKNIEKILKGLNPDFEIEKFDVVHYPVYVAHVGNKEIVIDAVSGKEI
jgi:DNA-binding transcriptional ArsR family regulator